MSQDQGSAFRWTAALVMVTMFASPTAQGGLVHEYRFDGNGIDSAGSAHGTVGSNVIFDDTGVPVCLGQAAVFGATFNGPDDEIVVPNADFIDFGTGDFTIAVWLRRDHADSFSADGIMDALSGTGNGWQMLFNTSADEELRLAVFLDGEVSATFDMTTLITDTDWHHVVITVDRSETDGLKFYLDGVLETTLDPTPVSGAITPNQDLRIGQLNTGGNRGMDGALALVQVYDHALSSAEAMALTFDAGEDDGDSVCNGVDLCPGTPPGGAVDADGCSITTNITNMTTAVSYNTIQDAIDNANAMDVLELQPDTYNEAIDFLGKAITVRSTDPTEPAVVAATIIDGTGLDSSVIRSAAGEGADTLLNGFTVTGGAGLSVDGDRYGGGMYIAGSSPMVMNCVFTANNAIGANGSFGTAGDDGLGGAIYIADGAPTVVSCTLTGNTARGGTGATGVGGSGGIGRGGGVYLILAADATFVDCTFSSNVAQGGRGGSGTSPGTGGTGYGGAVEMLFGNTTFESCTFKLNEAHPGRGGNGFPANDGPAGSACGGAISNSGGVQITNCVFSFNRAVSELIGSTSFGGALCSETGGTATFANCTLFANQYDAGGGTVFVSGGSVSMSSCIVWLSLLDEFEGNAVTVIASNVQGGYAGPGNIDLDPLFADVFGLDGVPGTDDDDLRLAAGSPCIDAGDNGGVPSGVTTDLDGNPRFVDVEATPDTGLGDCIVVDMGAFESQDGLTSCCTADLNGDGIVSVVDLLVLLAFWGTPDGDLDGDGMTSVTDLLLMLGSWGTC